MGSMSEEPIRVTEEDLRQAGSAPAGPVLQSVRITGEDLEQPVSAPVGPAPQPGTHQGRKRLITIVSASVGGILVLLAIAVVISALTPNRRCWRQIRGALEGLSDQPTQGQLSLAVKRLEDTDVAGVTDADLVEARDLSLEILKYLVDYPPGLEGMANRFLDGLAFDVPSLVRHLTMGPEKPERLNVLLKTLQARYGG